MFGARAGRLQGGRGDAAADAGSSADGAPGNGPVTLDTTCPALTMPSAAAAV